MTIAPRVYLGLLGLVLAVLLRSGPAKADDAVGQVLTLRGACVVVSAGRSTSLAAGSAVHVGDIVDVPPGGRLKLQMDDGSIISAGAGTHLTIASYVAGTQTIRRDVQLDLATGVLRAVVAAATQPSRFEVDTAIGVAAVRSTDWFIASGPGGTQVGVQKGVVTLTDSTWHHTVRIAPRWGARIKGPGLAPTQPRLWKPAEFANMMALTAAP